MKKNFKGGSGAKMKSLSGNAKRPPKVKGRVANDLWPNPVRSAAGPPPQGDTNWKRPK